MAIGDSGGTGKSARHITTLPVLHTTRSSRRANHARGRKALRRVSLCPWRIGAITAAALVLLHHMHDRTT
jgi:hypothetical protein